MHLTFTYRKKKEQFVTQEKASSGRGDVNRFSIFHFQVSKCLKCHPSCTSCSGPSETECTSCASPNVLDPWSGGCTRCCPAASSSSPASGDRCCFCDEEGDKCLQGSDGDADRSQQQPTRKRSFREDVGRQSRSALVFAGAVCLAAAITCIVLRLASRHRIRLIPLAIKARKKRKRRAAKKTSSAAASPSYRLLPVLAEEDASDDVEDEEEDDEAMLFHSEVQVRERSPVVT